MAAGYTVKRIHVMPGQRLSYQTHVYRCERWVVIFGIANQHAEELVIIEVQHGAYTGEDGRLPYRGRLRPLQLEVLMARSFQPEEALPTLLLQTLGHGGVLVAVTVAALLVLAVVYAGVDKVRAREEA